MIHLILDFETYYDQDYSLRKMSTQAYIQDPRFEILGMGYGWLRDLQLIARGYLTPDQIPTFLNAVPPDATLVGHNLLFDAKIVQSKIPGYFMRFAGFIDTLGLSRYFMPHIPRHDLDSAAKAVGHIGKVKASALRAVKGVRFAQLTPDQQDHLEEYCLGDVLATSALLQALYPFLPEQERELMSLTTRIGAVPLLQLDRPTLESALQEQELEYQQTLTKAGVPIATLSSNDKFLEHLKTLNIGLPKSKESPSVPGKMIPALGQNDLDYREFVAQHPQHEDLFAARKAVKSTIGRTRIKRFLQLTEHNHDPSSGRSPVTMPLNYYGAATGRWSGADKLNVQNLPRGSKLRKAFYAPPGYLVNAADLSGIELRMNLWFCNEVELLDTIAAGGDLYVETAARFYNKPPERITPTERSLGKVLQLSCGYGQGAKKFRTVCALGPMGSKPIYLSEQEAEDAIKAYRSSVPMVVQMWRRLNTVLSWLANPTTSQFPFGPNEVLSISYGAITMPGGAQLTYPLTRSNDDDTGWEYGSFVNPKRIYGAHLLENIIQALARQVIAQQMLILDAHPLITVVSMTHDEILTIFHESDRDECERYIEQVMSTTPDWAPGLPLAVQAKTERYYAK